METALNLQYYVVFLAFPVGVDVKSALKMHRNSGDDLVIDAHHAVTTQLVSRRKGHVDGGHPHPIVE